MGNGQGCRQTERWLAEAVEAGVFFPLVIRYTIVSEAGASIYSASPLADTELPDLDVSVRGAVSIARRLQDPLAEMVKIEPRHLGVGMYQHDLPHKRLEEVVNEVMEECISFVGVDVNTAQQHVLARVAGLSQAKAKEIINYRTKHGRFRCRNELNKVKGIGPATYAQCAGFLRVKPVFCPTRMDASRDVDFISLCTEDEDGADDIEMEVICSGKRCRLVSAEPGAPLKKLRHTSPSTTTTDDAYFNPLDQTAIHPASYGVATALVEHLRHEISDVGCMPLRNKAKALFASPNRDAVLAAFTTEEFGLETVRDILDALCRPLDFDERESQFVPLFRSSVISISNLRKDLQVTGRVENVTTFGAFVDIGVEENAFIPIQKFPRQTGMRRLLATSGVAVGGIFAANRISGGGEGVMHLPLHLGDRIQATIESFCAHTKRISLTDVELLR
ncbi:unnamed protein product [Mesocestoides corti]|uniref:S1 motif domain-containing protein n=1 Tax=Mesocestoides corti TaxID=53468 RepID=A0A3P6HT82_MESCO|nr:unnamed protein product [Mesocestoides corti]